MRHIRIKSGFTLIELLVVIAIISILAALIFPVFASVRGKARQAVCTSNERQIGMAMAMYAQDADDLFPYGMDPSDFYTPIWAHDPGSFAQLQELKDPDNMLDHLLAPYIKSPSLWHCPSDSGYDALDMNFGYDPATGTYGPIPLKARPTAFEKFRTSYLFRTELALKRKSFSAVTCFDYKTPHDELGNSRVNIILDGNGGWHGGILGARRYNVLMADGHVVSQNSDQFDESWRLCLESDCSR